MAKDADQIVKTGEWTIVANDWPSFDIVRAKSSATAHSDEFTNGVYASRLAAVEQVIDDFEVARRKLAEQISRAKRMRSRLIRAAQGIEARSDETRRAAQPEGQEPGREAMRPEPGLTTQELNQ